MCFLFQKICDNENFQNNNAKQSTEDDDKENDAQLNSDRVLATKNKQVSKQLQFSIE